MLVVLVVFLLKNPILKYLTATLPAKEIRVQAPD